MTDTDNGKESRSVIYFKKANITTKSSHELIVEIHDKNSTKALTQLDNVLERVKKV